MAGLSLSLLVVIAVVVALVIREQPYRADPGRTGAGTVQPGGATQTLQALERAVDQRDESAAADLAAPGDREAAALLTDLVRNARELDVEEFTMRYVDEAGAVTAEGTWLAAVDTTWRFDGFDADEAHAEVAFGFRSVGGTVALTSIGGTDRRSPLWLTDRLEVRRTPETLVLVAGSSAEADAYARRARAAVPIVRRVLPGWQSGLVVEVPDSVDGLHEVLGATPGEYAAIAAVTTSADGSLAPSAPVHVFANPDVFGALKSRGAQVVMSHEATHVATQAATSALPLWLLEGFADYVALRDVRLPLTRTAAQVIGQVRKDGVPDELPGAAEFDTGTPHLGAAYESAWLVCEVLADRGSEQQLLRLYERVSAGDELGTALGEVFGLTEREVVRLWQDRLRDLAV